MILFENWSVLKFLKLFKLGFARFIFKGPDSAVWIFSVLVGASLIWLYTKTVFVLFILEILAF